MFELHEIEHCLIHLPCGQQIKSNPMLFTATSSPEREKEDAGMKFIQQLKIKTSQACGTPIRSIPERSTGSVVCILCTFFFFFLQNAIFKHPIKEDTLSNYCFGIKSIVAPLVGSESWGFTHPKVAVKTSGAAFPSRHAWAAGSLAALSLPATSATLSTTPHWPLWLLTFGELAAQWAPVNLVRINVKADTLSNILPHIRAGWLQCHYRCRLPSLSAMQSWEVSNAEGHWACQHVDTVGTPPVAGACQPAWRYHNQKYHWGIRRYVHPAPTESRSLILWPTGDPWSRYRYTSNTRQTFSVKKNPTQNKNNSPERFTEAAQLFTHHQSTPQLQGVLMLLSLCCCWFPLLRFQVRAQESLSKPSVISDPWNACRVTNWLAPWPLLRKTSHQGWFLMQPKNSSCAKPGSFWPHPPSPAALSAALCTSIPACLLVGDFPWHTSFHCKPQETASTDKCPSACADCSTARSC